MVVGGDFWTVARLLLQSSSDEGDLFWFLLFCFGGGLFAIYWGWTRYRRYALIRDTPTSKIRSMAVGRTEIEGTALPVDEPLQAPFTDDPCLYADWQVEEYRYDHQDEDHDWVTIASGQQTCKFFLADDTGRVLVRADRGDPDFDLSDDHERTITVGGGERPPAPIQEFIANTRDDWDLHELAANPVRALGGVVGNDGRIGDSSNRRRYRQAILPVEHHVYIFGSAEPRPIAETADRRAGANEDLLEVGPDGSTGLFLISDRSEDRLTDYYSKMSPVAIGGGLLVSAVALYFLLSLYILA